MALQHRFLKPPSPGAFIPALSKNALSIPWPKVCSALGYAVRGKILSVANGWTMDLGSSHLNAGT